MNKLLIACRVSGASDRVFTSAVQAAIADAAKDWYSGSGFPLAGAGVMAPYCWKLDSLE